MRAMREDFVGERMLKLANTSRQAQQCKWQIQHHGYLELKVRSIDREITYADGLTFEQLKERLLDPEITAIDRSIDNEGIRRYHVRRAVLPPIASRPSSINACHVSGRLLEGQEKVKMASEELERGISKQDIVYVSRHVDAITKIESFLVHRQEARCSSYQ